MTKNKVYYGEYTLQHWIDLILTENIVLPDYQRFFVWEKNKSKALMNALSENQFVPPVTIGSYIENGKKQNLILDGQQRLTSILLAYLDIFPNREENKVKGKNLYCANENDDQDDDETDFINWDFNQLLNMMKEENLRDKSEIVKKALEKKYETMGFEDRKNVFENCYLGFSFIVPATEDSKEQQRFYSKAFRSINIEGKVLLPLESRAALYYLNKDLVGLFSPAFVTKISINDSKIDFVRYLAILSQYAKGAIDTIARGYSKNMEIYYETFIYSVVDDKETKDFAKLSDKIENLNYDNRIHNLETAISEMKLEKNFESIIYLDMYLFGLVYFILFEGKQIDSDRYDELCFKIQKQIEKLKEDLLHVKNPSALRHLKMRIVKSIEICKEFTV